MDPLADVLMSMRVESVLYGRLEATAPWGLSFEAPAQAKFGVIVRGNCWLTVEGAGEPIRLAAGDCYLLPRGNAYSMRDDPSTSAVSFCALVNGSRKPIMRIGGGGELTTILGGKFTFDGLSSRMLTDALPPVIHVQALGSTPEFQATLQLISSELTTAGPGSQVILSRLADILFVQGIRAYLASRKSPGSGWLCALTDSQIAAALGAMHESPGYAWTVAELAARAGMSRSAFALRFKEVVGDSPLEYLTRLRMYEAGRLLRGGKGKLLDVARAVGYDSDGAFNRAFKRELGLTPGEYRRNFPVSGAG